MKGLPGAKLEITPPAPKPYCTTFVFAKVINNWDVLDEVGVDGVGMKCFLSFVFL